MLYPVKKTNISSKNLITPPRGQPFCPPSQLKLVLLARKTLNTLTFPTSNVLKRPPHRLKRVLSAAHPVKPRPWTRSVAGSSVHFTAQIEPSTNSDDQKIVAQLLQLKDQIETSFKPLEEHLETATNPSKKTQSTPSAAPVKTNTAKNRRRAARKKARRNRGKNRIKLATQTTPQLEAKATALQQTSKEIQSPIRLTYREIKNPTRERGTARPKISDLAERITWRSFDTKAPKHLVDKFEVFTALTHALDIPWKEQHKDLKVHHFVLNRVRAQYNSVDHIQKRGKTAVENAHWSILPVIPVMFYGKRNQVFRIEGTILFRKQQIGLSELINTCRQAPALLNRIDDVIEYGLRPIAGKLLVSVMNGTPAKPANNTFKSKYIQFLKNLSSDLADRVPTKTLGKNRQDHRRTGYARDSFAKLLDQAKSVRGVIRTAVDRLQKFQT